MDVPNIGDINMIDLETTYNECLSKIFNWALFRNKNPINRDEVNLDPIK